MLIEFRIENHRSLRDEQVLTMEAGRVGDSEDTRPRQVPGHSEPLLPVAALYGANASGKSNVLSALSFMRNAVLHSHRSWAPDDGVPCDPFAWGPKKNEPSMFEATLLIASIRYEYGFVASNQAFLEEWLYAWPNNKKQVWYERDNNTYKFGENLKGENKLIETVTRENALFLSSAAQHGHPQLQRLFSWFRDLRPLNPPLSHSRLFRSASPYLDLVEEIQQPSLFSSSEPETVAERFRAMLKNADIGIVDMRVVQAAPGNKAYRIQLKHESSLHEAWLPLEEESKGTQRLFHMALPVLQTLRDGAVLLVDELEASLHPSLAQEIVNLFNNPRTNPRNAQMIFTTHDTNLLGTTLGESALRRDQVWLTEKDPEGATVLYPLTDYKPRKAENLERGYLQGRYGAIPFLGSFAAHVE
jgi:uncharacterized protein